MTLERSRPVHTSLHPHSHIRRVHTPVPPVFSTQPHSTPGDAQEVLELIEGRLGLLSILDEQCRLPRVRGRRREKRDLLPSLCNRVCPLYISHTCPTHFTHSSYWSYCHKLCRYYRSAPRRSWRSASRHRPPSASPRASPARARAAATQPPPPALTSSTTRGRYRTVRTT